MVQGVHLEAMAMLSYLSMFQSDLHHQQGQIPSDKAVLFIKLVIRIRMPGEEQ